MERDPVESECSKRDCRHLQGVTSEDGDANEVWVCAAFPKGIPSEIAFGNNKHTSPLKGQGNNIVYEKYKEE